MNEEIDADRTARIRLELDRERTKEEIAAREAIQAAQQPVGAPPSVEQPKAEPEQKLMAKK